LILVFYEKAKLKVNFKWVDRTS